MNKIPSITENVRIALSGASHIQLPLDSAAVTSLLRLSMLLDSLFDLGETKDLPQLLARHTALLDQLKLTPKSRAEVAGVGGDDSGQEFAESYLRLVTAPTAVKASSGSKPRKSSSRSSGKSGDASNGVAKARSKPVASN